MNTPLEAIENQVAELLASALAPYEALLADSWELVDQALDLAAQRRLPPRGNLLLVLLTRLLGETRVVHWAATKGYAVQAMSLAATVQELAYQAIYVGASDEETRRWAEHEREDKAYPECGHFAVLQRAATLLHYPEQWIQPNYRLYQQLCLAKHGNPLLAAQYAAIERADHLVEVLPSPHYSERIAHYARFALLHSVRATHDALTFFGEHHLADVPNVEVVKQSNQILARVQEIGRRDRLLEVIRPDGIIADAG